MRKKTSTYQPSPGHFYAMLLIGTGLVLTGITVFMILNNSAKSVNDFSTIPVKVDIPAPELTLEDTSGKTVSLKDYLGMVVLVNLWATWCPPCREEMPTLQTYFDKYKTDGFVLIGVNQEETRDVVLPFVKEFNLTFPVWLDIDYQAQKQFNTMSLPSSYVIDRDGKVRLMWIGGISKSELEKYVTDLIEE
jgi:cytochrome c biogenesis protein CcmG, thiol:disulfide interchange protein DsbE